MPDQSTANLALLVALVAAISSLMTVVISSVFTLWNTSLTRKYELHKHLQQLAVTSAIEEWKKTMDLATEQSKAQSRGIWVGNLAMFLIHNTKIIEVCNDPTTNASNIQERLLEVDELYKVVKKHFEENTMKKNKLESRT